ncbi:UNVERIFIED_CONTAM: hypothetical protein FKN15_074167 [Acipenser sinensis]
MERSQGAGCDESHGEQEGGGCSGSWVPWRASGRGQSAPRDKRHTEAGWMRDRVAKVQAEVEREAAKVQAEVEREAATGIQDPEGSKWQRQLAWSD